MSAGVIVMMVLMVVAFCSAQGRGPDADGYFGSADSTVSLPALPPSEGEPPRTPEVVAPTPPPPVVPGLSPRSTDLEVAPEPPTETAVPPPPPSPVPSPAESTQPSRPSARATTPPARRSPVTGTYQLMNSYGDAFIAEVRLANTGSRAEEWRTRLVFPQGRLVTAWVESAEQGRAEMTGSVFSYTGGAELAPGAAVSLRFHLERTGSTTRPVTCTVNGADCVGF
ncbi:MULTISPECIES: cellulose binding domain-containing protein [Micromonospora]|uniref:cellulose binding domain-containing protein n=1 Tax=Micromonospora TaxID=1873 RepID=UPI001E300AA0|nr:cellulose binding domain-containing protein [Micromonospora yangpuensis]